VPKPKVEASKLIEITKPTKKTLGAQNLR